MIIKDTLIIRHLPKELTQDDIKYLLNYFGSTSIKILSKKQGNIAYAKFDSEQKARNVMTRLHQVNILGSYLSIEYVRNDISLDNVSDPNTVTNKDFETRCFKTFLNKLNSWNAAVDFYQPPPPHLKYLYPQANRATINNIGHALASVPKFYTQVLHLMNKMNLPPPFSNVPDPVEELYHESNPNEINKQNSSEESELESDTEEFKGISQIVCPKRMLPTNKKIVKRPKFIKPMQVTVSQKSALHSEDVFENVSSDNIQKKIELKVYSKNVENIGSDNIDEDIGEINKISVSKPEEKEMIVTEEEEKSKIKECIMEKELNENRITDFSHITAFNNYHPGAPSCRLYIKNLSKTVVENDLYYIYNRYNISADSSEQGMMFDVRLMQEGRMKGQAFITLPNIECAQKALDETNGFILKKKPMVVVFARSSKSIK